MNSTATYQLSKIYKDHFSNKGDTDGVVDSGIPTNGYMSQMRITDIVYIYVNYSKPYFIHKGFIDINDETKLQFESASTGK